MSDLEKDFKTVSCDGFWAFSATPGGEEERARQLVESDLVKDFKTVSCNGFWVFLATPGGELKEFIPTCRYITKTVNIQDDLKKLCRFQPP